MDNSSSFLRFIILKRHVSKGMSLCSFRLTGGKTAESSASDVQPAGTVQVSIRFQVMEGDPSDFAIEQVFAFSLGSPLSLYL